MRTLMIAALLLLHGAAFAQETNKPAMSYSFGEIRYVDVDDGGNGFKLAGSYQFTTHWIGVASFRSLDFRNSVEVSSFEIGAGYIYPVRQNWDLQANARVIRTEVDSRFGSGDDTGIGLLGGLRGMVIPELEIRGNVHYVNIEESDVFLELAGDWYITPRFAAGLSVEFGGDVDLWTIGARYFFK